MSIGETTRVAVIGAAKWSHEDEDLQIDCVEWNTLFSAINLRDYDEWVMDLQSIPERVAKSSILGSLTPSYLYECLTTGLMIYLLGDPRLEVNFETETKPFLEWTGYRFDWDDTPGTVSSRQTSLCKNYHLDEYLSTFSKSSYGLKGIAAGQGFALAKKPVNTIGQLCTFQLQWLTSTRYNVYPSCAISFLTFNQLRNEVPQFHGAILFVPTVPHEPENALARFLKATCDIDLGSEQPAWLEDLAVPGQDLLDAEIANLTRERQKLDRAVEDKNRERSVARSSLAVLYQSGLALEIAVKKMLADMGAQIIEATKSGNEDGRVTIEIDGKTFEGVLEIKSVKKPTFDIDGLRQVSNWVQAAQIEKSRRFKGIFIGNHMIAKPPAQRSDPFSPQWKSSSTVLEVAALSTITLFTAYRRIKEGTLEVQRFWKGLFTTNGIFRLSDTPD
jgi:hypothetical protein